MTTTRQKKNEPASAPGVIQGTVDARAFTDRLKLIRKHSAKSFTIPILNFVRLRFDLGISLKISYCDLDMEITTSIPASPGIGTGDVCVPLRSLAAFMVPASSEGGTVTIEKGETDSHVTFRCGRYSARFVPLPSEDYPIVPTPDVYPRAFTLAEGVLGRFIAMVAPFMGAEETRYYLNGMAFEFHENRVRVVATDGHKLGTVSASTPAPLEPWKESGIVPRNSVAALSSLIGKAEVTARFGDTKAEFTGNGWTLTTKLIDGTFPDWRRVVPKSTPEDIKVTFPAMEAARFAKMARSLDRSVAVKISQSPGGIYFATANSYEGVDISSDVPADMEGSGVDVSGTFAPFGVNFRYLAAVTAAIGTKKVAATVGSPGSPILLRGHEAGTDDAFAVLMPMRI